MTGSPEGLPGSPERFDHDVLSDVLALLSLTGEVQCCPTCTAPWAVRFPPETSHFYLIESGSCVITVPGLAPVRGAAGDLFLVCGRHDIADRAGRRTVALEEVKKHCRPDLTMEWGGGGRATALVCGSFRYDAVVAESFLAALPEVVQARGENGRVPETLALTVRLLRQEIPYTSVGSAAAAKRLVELMVVQALRMWLTSNVRNARGWFGALGDPQIGAALSRLHAAPGEAWTVDALAAAVGSSRSPLAARFKTLVGEPPMSYLMRLRMHLAARELTTTDRSVSQIARGVGYDSEAAFSRVFKRFHGVGPAAYKRTL